MWVLYSFTDANGKQAFTYAPSSQEPALIEIIQRAGGKNGRQLGKVANLSDILEHSNPDYQSAVPIDELMVLGGAEDGGNTTPTLADLANLGGTFRNFLTGQGIAPQGGLGQQANMLLAPAQALLGIGQGLEPSLENTGVPLNLTNLLSKFGLGGIAPESRRVFNRLANSGGGAIGEDTLQRPASEGSDLTQAVQNNAFGALFDNSPFFAAMFGRNAINNATDKFFEQTRATQPGGGGQGVAPGNIARFIQDQLGRNLFSGF